MNAHYKNYLSAKLRDTRHQSAVVRRAMAAMDSMPNIDDFTVVDVQGSPLGDVVSATQFNAIDTKQGRRLSFAGFGPDCEVAASLAYIHEAMDVNQRQWAKLFLVDEATGKISFDSYNEQYLEPHDIMVKCGEVAAQLNLAPGKCLVVDGWVGQCRPLLRELQARFEAVIIVDTDPDIELRRRVNLPKTTRDLRLGLNVDMSLGSLMQPTQFIAVPLVDATLDSNLLAGVSWRNLLDGVEPMGSIASTPMKYVNLRVEIDIFGNAFLEVRDLGSKKPKIVHAVAPFGTVSPEAAPRVPKSVTRPANTVAPPKHLERGSTPVRHDAPQRPASGVRSQPLDTFYILHPDFGTIEFPIAKMRKRFNAMSIDEMRDWDAKITTIYSRIFESQKIVTDTNFWVSEDENEPGRMEMFDIIESMVEQMRKRGGVIFEFPNYVYEEIRKLSETIGAAKQAKDYFARVLFNMRLLSIPGITGEQLRSSYADPQIFDFIAERAIAKGERLTVITNDADAMNRFHANKVNHADDTAGFPEPLFLISRDFKTLMDFRRRLRRRMRQLKQDQSSSNTSNNQ